MFQELFCVRFNCAAIQFAGRNFNMFKAEDSFKNVFFELNNFLIDFFKSFGVNEEQN